MPFHVDYSPRARTQLLDLYRYIANAGSPVAANNFVTSIVDYCDGFSTLPARGTPRNDVRPGLRTVGFRRRVVIAFTIDTTVVTVLGIFYGCQDWEAELSASMDSE